MIVCAPHFLIYYFWDVISLDASLVSLDLSLVSSGLSLLVVVSGVGRLCSNKEAIAASFMSEKNEIQEEKTNNEKNIKTNNRRTYR